MFYHISIYLLVFTVCHNFAATSASNSAQQGIINLTPENPTQIVFLDPLISDCPSSLTFSAPKGYTLDLYVDDNAVYGNYSLYDSQTTENFVTTLRNLPQPLEDYIPKNYESKSGFLTIAFHNNSISNSACLYIYYGVLFLRLREIHAANCLSTNNVYSMDDLQLTAKAKATGPCMLTVLNYYSTRVSLISASSPINNDQYEFIPQTNRAFPYLKFTNKDIDLWTDLYTLENLDLFSFVIPASQSLTFIYNNSLMYEHDEYGILYLYTHKGIWMSKCYTNTSCSKFDRYGTKISAQGVMQIRVNYFDFSENSRVSILSESIETVVTKVGQIITVKDDATIFMEEREDNHGQVLFEIEVLSSDAQEQSTTPTDSSGDKNNANASTSWMPLLFTFFISVLLYSLS